MAAAGRQVRNVYRLFWVRISLFPDFTRNSGIFASSARRVVASPMPLPMIPPTETAPCCCVKRRNPSMAAVVFVDWSSATARLSFRPCPRPFTPPDLLISFTASAAPARTWSPHGAKLAVSGVSTPSVMGPPCADPLDPP